MAKTYSLVCDGCEKKETTTNKILSLEGRRSDGKKFAVDLCPSCWKGIQRDYGLRERTKATSRRAFEVINPKDIPKA